MIQISRIFLLVDVEEITAYHAEGKIPEVPLYACQENGAN